MLLFRVNYIVYKQSMTLHIPLWMVVGSALGSGDSPIVNPRHACAVRLQYLVGLSVCVCLSTLSTGNEAAYERYQRLKNYASLKR